MPKELWSRLDLCCCSSTTVKISGGVGLVVSFASRRKPPLSRSTARIASERVTDRREIYFQQCWMASPTFTNEKWREARREEDTLCHKMLQVLSMS